MNYTTAYAYQVLGALDPTKEPGRQALQRLSLEELQLLRARFTPSRSAFVAMMTLCGAMLLTSGIGVPHMWAAIDALIQGHDWPRDLQIVASAWDALGALVAGFLVLGCFVITGLFGWPWARRLAARNELAVALSPISASLALCQVTLKTLEAPAALAYRNAVISQRELVRADATAMAELLVDWKREQQQALQGDACKVLHGIESSPASSS